MKNLDLELENAIQIYTDTKIKIDNVMTDKLSNQVSIIRVKFGLLNKWWKLRYLQLINEIDKTIWPA